jgi:hypothetical protein
MNIIKNNNTPNTSSNSLTNGLQQALKAIVKTNPYTAPITRATPAAFVFLIDQSGSMNDQIAGANGKTKAEAVADTVNTLLNSLINRCTKSEGIRDYFEIALIGYGAGENDEDAYLLWEGEMKGKDFVQLSELNQNSVSEKEVEVQETIRGKIQTSTKKIKTWILPKGEYRTPMKRAIEEAHKLTEKWITDHANTDNFPPIVINITDGQATDVESNEELLEVSKRIKELNTMDGHCLFLNIHIGEDDHLKVLFPEKLNDLPQDEAARLLYDMSSELPILFHQDIARAKGKDLGKRYVGMASNADVQSLIQFLNIGTSTSKGAAN